MKRWKTIDTFEDGGRRMALQQQYRITMRRNDEVYEEPMDTHRVIPVQRLLS